MSRFHGTGAGGALMKLAVDEARRRKARRLLLGVYAHNERARAFYAKHGFEPVARRRFRVGEQEYDDIVLAKSLGT